MSKQIKENCQKMIIKLQSKLQELKIFLKAKKSQTLVQKLLNHIINDFKFLHDEFKLITVHHSFLQNKTYEQEMLISAYQKQLLNKSAQKKMIEQMMRSKYEKMTKEQKFLDFAGKSAYKQHPGHHRTKSELLKKGLNQLQRDIADSNKRVCIKVKQLQQEIQNQDQQYLTFQNISICQNFEDLQLSGIKATKQLQEYPSKTLDKREKIRNLQLDVGEDLTVFKTRKKQLSSRDQREQEESREILKEDEAKSTQTVIINKKKKEELAELIAKQTKFIVTREKYFSTDI